MHLDELKILWNADPEEEPDFDRARLRAMLQNRSQTAMSKVRRNVWLEIILLVVFGAGVLAWFAIRELPVHWTEWILFTLLVPANGFLYWYKVRAFVARDDLNMDLAHSLDAHIQHLGSYIRLYKSYLIYVIPVLATVGIFYGFTIARLETGKGYEDLPVWIYPLLAAVTVVYSLFAVRFTKWYLKKVYGDHFDELVSVQQELQEAN